MFGALYVFYRVPIRVVRRAVSLRSLVVGLTSLFVGEYYFLGTSSYATWMVAYVSAFILYDVLVHFYGSFYRFSTVYRLTVLFFWGFVFAFFGDYFFGLVRFGFDGEGFSSSTLFVRQELFRLLACYLPFLVTKDRFFFWQVHLFFPVGVGRYRVVLSVGRYLVVVLSVGVSRGANCVFGSTRVRYLAIGLASASTFWGTTTRYRVSIFQVGIRNL